MSKPVDESLREQFLDALTHQPGEDLRIEAPPEVGFDPSFTDELTGSE